MSVECPPLSADIIESFQKMFSEFQARAEKLGNAYASMQEEFRKVNIELDKKNTALEESLSRQEEMQTYLDSILQSMDNGVIGIDAGGCITHFNRCAAEITGFTVTEVLGKPYTTIFQNNRDGDTGLLRVLHGAVMTSVMDEKVLWHRDGHPIPVSYRHSVLKDASGKRLGAVETFTDVSRIKALEEEMQQTRTMAALGEMSATVAHEIRNPLGAMGMWAALLERDLGDEDPRRTTLGKITEGLSRLNKIVSNLLVFTRPVKAEFRKVDIGDTVEEIIDFVKIEIERLDQDVAVAVKRSDTPLMALADPEKMGQVVLNLCLNALQAMPKGGAITVEISTAPGDYVVIVIQDTGVGIGVDDLDKIFDPFYTTKENGTGLGLAIVKKYVEFHAGYIDIASVAGKGTTVKVFVPLLKE